MLSRLLHQCECRTHTHKEHRIDHQCVCRCICQSTCWQIAIYLFPVMINRTQKWDNYILYYCKRSLNVNKHAKVNFAIMFQMFQLTLRQHCLRYASVDSYELTQICSVISIKRNRLYYISSLGVPMRYACEIYIALDAFYPCIDPCFKNVYSEVTLSNKCLKHMVNSTSRH